MEEEIKIFYSIKLVSVLLDCATRGTFTGAADQTEEKGKETRQKVSVFFFFFFFFFFIIIIIAFLVMAEGNQAMPTADQNAHDFLFQNEDTNAFRQLTDQIGALSNSVENSS